MASLFTPKVPAPDPSLVQAQQQQASLLAQQKQKADAADTLQIQSGLGDATTNLARMFGTNTMGGGVSRAFGAIRERIPGGGVGVTNITGVQVEVGEKQAAVDLDIVVEYGASIVDLARAVRRNVITAVERMTGLEVIEVNIAVNDIHLPEVEDEALAPVVSVPARVE